MVSQYDKTFEADIYADEDSEEEVERPKTADDGAEVNMSTWNLLKDIYQITK